MNRLVPNIALSFPKNATEETIALIKLPLRTYPISSWIFITWGGLSYHHPILIILFIIYIVYGCFNTVDTRPMGWLLDCIEFTIGYKLAIYGTKFPNKNVKQ